MAAIRYTDKQKDELFERVLEYIRKGLALRNILKKRDVFSDRVWREMVLIEDNRQRYARACEERADFLFEEMIRIANTPKKGKETTTKTDGKKETKEGDMIAHRRLQVDTYKWVIAKMNPKKYGDSAKLDLSSSDGSMSPKKLDLSKLTEDELRDYAALQSKLEGN